MTKTKKRTIKDALAEKAAAKASGKPTAQAKVPDEEQRYGFLVPFACGHLDLFEPGHNAKKCTDCRLFGDPAFREKSDALEQLRIEQEAKEKPAVIVTFMCGHRGLFELGHHAMQCMDCRFVSDADLRAARQALEQKTKEKPPAPAAEQLEPAAPGGLTNGSLPDGAVFVLQFSAATKTWSGSLKIGTDVFVGENAGRFKLMRVLDAEFRKTIARPEKPAEV